MSTCSSDKTNLTKSVSYLSIIIYLKFFIHYLYIYGQVDGNCYKKILEMKEIQNI